MKVIKIKKIINLINKYIDEHHQKPNKIIISKEDLEKLQNDFKKNYKKLTSKEVQFLMQLKEIIQNVDEPILFYEPQDIYLTVGELKNFLKDKPDYYKVYIERIEDVYFDKHGWTTEHFNFGNELESTEGIRAFGCGKINNKIIILAHY